MIGGEVWVLPPGWLHTSRWREPSEVIVLWIDDTRIKRSFGDLPINASFAQLTEYVAAVPNIAELCRELRHFASSPNGPDDWRIAAEGSHLATLLLKAHLMLTDGVFRPPSALVGGVLLRLKAHLAEHRHERVPLGKMARSLGVSDRHLRRIFRDAMGVSPQEWVIGEKVKQAAHLLVEGDSVKATVEKAGFTSDSHLHRAMLRVYGVSPSAFRKQAQFAAVPSRG